VQADLPHQYEVLLAKATADIHMAGLAIAHPDQAIDDATILFHIQQAVEKLLKSLLAFRAIHCGN
jgi:HEPN domain-containing protein